MWGKKQEYADGDLVVVLRPDYVRDPSARKVAGVMPGHVVSVFKQVRWKIFIREFDKGYLPRSAIVPLNDDALAHLDRRRFWQCVRRLWIDGFYPSRYSTWVYLTGRASILCELNQIDEAIQTATKAISLIPNGWTPYVLRARCQLAKGEFESVIPDCNKALKIRKSEGIAYCYRGEARLNLGEFEEAIRDFNAALEFGGDFDFSMERRGYAKCMLQQFEEALKDFEAVIATGRNSTGSKLGRTNLIRILRGPTDALAELDKIKPLAESTAEYQISLGYMLFQLEQLEDAKACFEKALQLESKHPTSWYGRAVISMLQRKTEHLDDFVNALKCGQRADLEMHLYSVMRGVLYSRILGEPHIEAALLGSGLDFSRLKWPYPELQFIRGEITEENLLTSASKDSEKGEAYCTLGLHYLSQQDRDKAAQYFRMSIEVGAPEYIETTIAKFELKRLEGQVSG